MDRYQMNRQGMSRQGYPQYHANCAAKPCSAPSAVSESCDCGMETAPVDEMTIAMGYVPMQKYNTIFEPCKALRVGTVFPELCRQFVGKRGKSC